LSVPTLVGGRTDEHYPDMQAFAIVEVGGQFCVVVKDNDGSFTLDTTPVFHEGAGQVLE
jgi:hypothetical protein